MGCRLDVTQRCALYLLATAAAILMFSWLPLAIFTPLLFTSLTWLGLWSETVSAADETLVQSSVSHFSLCAVSPCTFQI